MGIPEDDDFLSYRHCKFASVSHSFDVRRWFLGGLERLSQERLLVAISFIGMVPWGT